MMQKYMNVIFIILFFIIFFKLSSKEKMSQTMHFKKLIEENYKIDVDAIRNISKLANDLTIDNRLTIPGGLYIQGNVQIDGTVGIGDEAKDDIGIYINNQAIDTGIETNTSGIGLISKNGIKVDNESILNGKIKAEDGILNLDSKVRVDGTIGIKTNPHPSVGVKVRSGLTRISSS